MIPVTTHYPGTAQPPRQGERLRKRPDPKAFDRGVQEPLRPEHERYFERFSELLRGEYAPEERIDALREKFHGLPQGVGELPCPHCSAADRNSRLETLTFTGRLHALRCARCNSTIVVETGV